MSAEVYGPAGGAIVGLDLSLTSAGIAVLLPTSGGTVHPVLLRCVGEVGKKTDSYAQRSRRVRAQCRAVLELLTDPTPIALAVVEGPVYGQKTLPSYFDRAGLFHGVYGALDARGIPVAVIPPNTGHTFVTGRAKPLDDKKSDIVEEARRWWPAGPRVHNSDEADALGLALMGAMQLGHTPPFKARARHYNAIYSATWPLGEQRKKAWV